MSAAVSPVSNPVPQASLPSPAPAPKGPNGFAQMLNEAVQPQAQAPAEAAPADAPAETEAKPATTTDPKSTRPGQGKAQAADHAPAKNTRTKAIADAKADKSEKADKVDAGKHPRSEKQERVKAPEADATAAATPTPVVPQPEQKPVDVPATAAQVLVAEAALPKDAEAVVPQGEGTEESSQGKGHRPLRIGAGDGDGAVARGRAADKTDSRLPEAATRTETNASSAAAWQAVAERVALPVNGETAKAEVAALNAAAGANAALAAPVAAKPAEVAAAAPIHVPVPVTAPEFPQALGVQVSVLARDGIQQAELHLNPAEMGPVSIHIAIDGKQAQVNFGADSAVTRNAIENGLPELATALREAGFTLSGGGVHQQASGRREGGNESGPQGGSRGFGRDSGVADVPAATSVTLTGRTAAGGIDLYA